MGGFWRRVGRGAMQGLLQPSWFDKMTGNHSLQFSPAFIIADWMTRLFSPYELNPLNRNPLKDVLEASVDFEALRQSDSPIKLYLSATNLPTRTPTLSPPHQLCPHPL